MRAGVDVVDGRVLVDIKATVSETLLGYIEREGGEIINHFARYDAIRAYIPLERILLIAARPEVRFIGPAVEARTQGTRPGKQTHKRGLIADAGIITNAGSITSQGDTTHSANTARSVFGINGTGVRIGVISDGVDQLAESQAAGELPATVILSGQAGSGSEGTAMLEIVHDLAPGAQLYFATAINGTASFAQNIRNLRAAGCDIIVDDIIYLNEAPFQDGPIAQAVDSVTAEGALYFSSAGNGGNVNDATSTTWEGDYVDSGQDLSVDDQLVGSLHSFGSDIYNTVLTSNSGSRVDFFWSDPLDGSGNDYDMYVLNADGTEVVRFSNDFQDGNDDPYESVAELLTGERIVLVLFAGERRYLHLSTSTARLSFATSGQTRGHAAAAAAFGIAAVNAATSFPNPFSGGTTNPVETFSSDGLRRIFYQSDGAPITPGNLLATGGTVRQKPDLAAADGVSTSVSGFTTFFGTSAAAPHAAAIAGLVKSYRAALSSGQIRSLLTKRTLGIEAAGVDRDSGFGIVMAPPSIDFIPLLVPGDFNIDARPDILWRNQATGRNTVWLMNNTSLVSTTDLPAVTNLDWRIVGTADFNGDFRVDVLWRNIATGQNILWLMNGTTLSATAPLPSIQPDTGWQIDGTGDFNYDRKPDILWRNLQTGANVIWLLNGTAFASSVTLTPVPNPDWRMVGSGYFNSDGGSDILWRNVATGQNVVWLMNGTALASTAAIPSVTNLDWDIGGVGDYNSDGQSDILWRNFTTGQNVVWLMNGTMLTGTTYLTTVTDLIWDIRGPR